MLPAYKKPKYFGAANMRNRKKNWRDDFEKFVDSYRDKPFRYGDSDCCLFIADCVKSISETALDPAADYRGHYDDENSGRDEIMNRHGSIKNALLQAGLIEIDKNLLMPSDAVICTIGNYEICGVCVGHNIAFMCESGLKFVPESKVQINTVMRLF